MLDTDIICRPEQLFSESQKRPRRLSLCIRGTRKNIAGHDFISNSEAAPIISTHLIVKKMTDDRMTDRQSHVRAVFNSIEDNVDN